MRLNNIPYSQIPGDILANLKLQRQQRKNVTLTTTKDFFNTSKLAICAQQLSSPNGGLRTPSKAGRQRQPGDVGIGVLRAPYRS